MIEVVGSTYFFSVMSDDNAVPVTNMVVANTAAEIFAIIMFFKSSSSFLLFCALIKNQGQILAEARNGLYMAKGPKEDCAVLVNWNNRNRRCDIMGLNKDRYLEEYGESSYKRGA